MYQLAEFVRSGALFELSILQVAPQSIVFGEKEDVLVEPQSEQDTQVDTYCHGGGTFLHTHHGQWRTGGTLGNLRNAEIATQTSQTNLLTYDTQVVRCTTRKNGSYC